MGGCDYFLIIIIIYFCLVKSIYLFFIYFFCV